MSRKPWIACFLTFLPCFLVGPALRAADPAPGAKAAPKPASFVRLRRDKDDRPTALETAVVRLVPSSGKGGVTVDLIAAVHLGDKGYYDKLNKLMEEYDVLLYELVAPPGTVPQKGKLRTDNPLALIQQAATLVLGLELQTEWIDYRRKNFVHADLSPEQMAEAIRERGDDGFTLFLSVTADLLRQQNLQERNRRKKPAAKEAEIDLTTLLFDPDGAAKLKRLMAEQLAAVGTGATGLGSTLNTILVADRNKAALKVFQKELARGRKRIGIFYGAAHMPDFEKRLGEDFGLRRGGERWLTAWDLKAERDDLDDLMRLLRLLGQ